jgi:hypothetical protein
MSRRRLWRSGSVSQCATQTMAGFQRQNCTPRARRRVPLETHTHTGGLSARIWPVCVPSASLTSPPGKVNPLIVGAPSSGPLLEAARVRPRRARLSYGVTRSAWLFGRPERANGSGPPEPDRQPACRPRRGDGWTDGGGGDAARSSLDVLKTNKSDAIAAAVAAGHFDRYRWPLCFATTRCNSAREGEQALSIGRCVQRCPWLEWTGTL